MIFLCMLLQFQGSVAQDDQKDREIKVSLRMIGHKVLLSSGDSTSRVLPIIKENNRYRIQFESEFDFIPEELVSAIDGAVKKTKLAKNYIVEVEHCKTGEVVYSFKIDEIVKSDIVPCKSRIQSKACYNVLFTLVEPIESNTKKINYTLLGLLIGLIALVSFFLWKRKIKSSINPNWIRLGDYYFDKRNTELIIEQKRIELTSKEADLLLLLYSDANKTVEREVILNMVWGDEGDYVGRTLDVFISKLRKKLEFDSKVKIVNVRGVGYKLVMNN